MQQRLFEITYLLTEHSSLTAGELAGRFGVSTRTIYRDIDALSAAGIPVYAEKGRGGGIRMLPDYVLDRTMFTREEQEQLVSHFDSLASLQTPGSRELADKLGAMFGRRDPWLEIDFMPWAGGDEARALFNLLRESILTRKPVAFAYSGADGKSTPRTVEPLKILFRGQGWYLQAWCRTRQDFRIFKLTRIHGARALDEEFARREPPSLQGEYQTSHPLYEYVMRIDAPYAFRVYDEFAPEAIEVQPDGSFVVRALYPDDEWVIGYLLSYGGALEVLEPQAIRARLQKILENSLKKYLNNK